MVIAVPDSAEQSGAGTDLRRSRIFFSPDENHLQVWLNIAILAHFSKISC